MGQIPPSESEIPPAEQPVRVIVRVVAAGVVANGSRANSKEPHLRASLCLLPQPIALAGGGPSSGPTVDLTKWPEQIERLFEKSQILIMPVPKDGTAILPRVNRTTTITEWTRTLTKRRSQTELDYLNKLWRRLIASRPNLKDLPEGSETRAVLETYK